MVLLCSSVVAGAAAHLSGSAPTLATLGGIHPSATVRSSSAAGGTSSAPGNSPRIATSPGSLPCGREGILSRGTCAPLLSARPKSSTAETIMPATSAVLGTSGGMMSTGMVVSEGLGMRAKSATAGTASERAYSCRVVATDWVVATLSGKRSPGSLTSWARDPSLANSATSTVLAMAGSISDSTTTPSTRRQMSAGSLSGPIRCALPLTAKGSRSAVRARVEATSASATLPVDPSTWTTESGTASTGMVPSTRGVTDAPRSP